MSPSRLSLSALAITFALVALAGAAIALARPKPIENAMLGPQWQCNQIAFVITTCSPRIRQASAEAQTADKVTLRAHKP